jgi:hypothetical protein
MSDDDDDEDEGEVTRDSKLAQSQVNNDMNFDMVPDYDEVDSRISS